MLKIATFVLLQLAMAPLLTDAHSWLVTPVSRETGPQSDENGSMGCPSNTPGQSTSFAAGETIKVRYPRNNHLGGFIRWAMVPLGKESKSAFDDNVIYYTCRESGSQCVPDGTDTMYSGDNGAAANSILCGDTIKLPDWLDAGDYVLQWTWHSVGSSYGNIGWAEPQFRSCADIKITSDGTGTQPSCPTFVGGDRVTALEGKSNDQCWYFYTNDIVTSAYKGSNDDYESNYKYGLPALVENCSGGSGNSTSSLSNEADSGSTASALVDSTDASAATANEASDASESASSASQSTKTSPPIIATEAPTPAPSDDSKCSVKRR